MLTVGKLKQALAGLPDDAPVLVRPHGEEERARPPWNYNTREVQNAYRANDDRYAQNRCLTVELGEISP